MSRLTEIADRITAISDLWTHAAVAELRRMAIELHQMAEDAGNPEPEVAVESLEPTWGDEPVAEPEPPVEEPQPVEQESTET